MPAIFNDDLESPLARLSNRYRAYPEIEGKFFHTVQHYIIAQKYKDTPLLDQIDWTGPLDKTEALVAQTTYPARADWDQVKDDIVRTALVAKFETNLRCRTVLLSTGHEPIVYDAQDEYWGQGSGGNGQNRLGQLLVEVREIVRLRAEDINAIQCHHQGAEQTGCACTHMLESLQSSKGHRRFTGCGLEFEIICDQCACDPASLAASRRKVCADCFRELTLDLVGSYGPEIGSPEIRTRPTQLAFSHRDILLNPPIDRRVVGIEAIAGNDKPVWIALSESGVLYTIDTSCGSTHRVGALPPASINLAQRITLRVSSDGRFAVVAETRGQRGVVIDLVTGHSTVDLRRDNYHIAVSDFPIAFFSMDERTYLVHGTAWNRLDISDPATGKLLTERAYAPPEEGSRHRKHYLDYFHGDLSVSPNGEWVADDGWVWHPVGDVTVWSMKQWLKANVWESEDGPSRKSLCCRYYFWGGPLCWVDDRRLAVWGHGDDDELIIPAVRLFDAETGQEIRSFAGPKGALVFDGHLYAFSADHGTSVWDVETGERLLNDEAFCPTSYHHGTHEFISLESSSQVRVSQLGPSNSRSEPE